MWKSLLITGLLLTPLGCAAQKKQIDVEDGRQMKPIVVLLENDSAMSLYYRYTEFQDQSENDSMGERTVTKSLSFQVQDLQLKPGQSVRLRVFPQSDLVLRFGDNKTTQTLKVSEPQTLTFEGEAILKKPGVPDFTP